jgi:hypothetical protein
LREWLWTALLFVPGVCLAIVGLVVVESVALVVLGVAILLAPALISFLLDGTDGTWW